MDDRKDDRKDARLDFGRDRIVDSNIFNKSFVAEEELESNIFYSLDEIQDYLSCERGESLEKR